MLRRLLLGTCAIFVVEVAPAFAVESFIGRWSINPAGCVSEGDTAATAPLIATATSVKWFVADCRIGKMYKIGQAVHLQAHCSSEGKIRSTPITLDARGDRMRVIWDGVKVEEMRRCK
jgi:hypothetical protein